MKMHQRKSLCLIRDWLSAQIRSKVPPAYVSIMRKVAVILITSACLDRLQEAMGTEGKGCSIEFEELVFGKVTGRDVFIYFDQKAVVEKIITCYPDKKQSVTEMMLYEITNLNIELLVDIILSNAPLTSVV